VPPEEPVSKHAPGVVRFRPNATTAKSVEEFLNKELQARYTRRESRAVKPERGGVGLRHLGLAMALLALALATLLIVFHSSASPPVEAAPQGKEVCAVETISPFDQASRCLQLSLTVMRAMVCALCTCRITLVTRDDLFDGCTQIQVFFSINVFLSDILLKIY